jgi:hypothetical protein
MHKRLPCSSRLFNDEPIPQMLESNHGTRLNRIEEGRNTADWLQGQPSMARGWARFRRRYGSIRRAIMVVVCFVLSACVLGATRAARSWEQRLVGETRSKNEICTCGKVFGKHIRVLGFAEAQLPVMYFPMYDAVGASARLRSVEQSDLCPTQASKMRYETVQVAYRALPWLHKTRTLTVHGLSSACIQHFAGAWNNTC